MADIVRAPRLTDGRLDDLEQCLEVLDGEIEHLDGIVRGSGFNGPTLARFKDKLGRLQRGRAWIAGKVAAERSQRGQDAPTCTQQGCQRPACDACDFAQCPGRASQTTGDLLGAAVHA
jgi:hypothetical protein